MVEEEALKTINEVNKIERELRILENDNISKPGIAKMLKEFEKRGKMGGEELLRYMYRKEFAATIIPPSPIKKES